MRYQLCLKAEKKDYNIDLIEFLSQLYDGTVEKRYTRKAKLEQILGCYICFLGATTPYLYEVLDADVFIQGLGNRIMYDYWHGRVKEYSEKELFFDPRDDSKRYERIDEFAENLAKLQQMYVYILSPDGGSAKVLTSFYNKTHEMANKLYNKSPFDLRASYIARCGEFAIKLAGIKAVSRAWLAYLNPN